MRLRSSLATSTVSVALLLTATTAAGAVTPSDATTTGRSGIGASAPPRENSTLRPVFFIKGYTPGDKCGDKWKSAVKLFNKSKWKGELHRVGFYGTDDAGCDVRIDPGGQGTADTSLKDLGRELAWKIHTMYSSKGQTVDLVGHSMGGLIARAAVAGYEQGDPTWPDTLFVEDVVTLGTPHKGVRAAHCVINRQCQEMYPDSTFRRWLGTELPQAQGGTDWTLIGSNADWSVSAGNAAPTDVWAQHLVRYSERSNIDHSALRTHRTGVYPLRYTNNGGAWGSLTRGAAPLRATMNALYWHRQW
ncbi:hypothetical protein HW130_13840 [Streptomyces sp. PKU-EA00015]|uniref:esterase/lipase family protein n=1 Tax=Streptomyces sp. PKU-EA00015 TaxID=2748326 RepID=UPI0015A330AB|nr:hypothetical protein [Streptomyces sp. PKU-EA00015]NWF27340.1 hypothetical protein [Streptomyces sp. PKU-EA00015]